MQGRSDTLREAFSKIGHARQVSRFSSPYVDFGVGAGLYLLGAATHSDHVRETGLLGSEAVLDAGLLTQGIKLATNRDRPNQGDGTGKFWPHGTDGYNLNSAMPSGHAATTWALARVVSMQYPHHRLLRVLVYGGALTVSTARVFSRDHFPSDVLVGSTFGFLIGGYVVRRRSARDPDHSGLTILPGDMKIRPKLPMNGHGRRSWLTLPPCIPLFQPCMRSSTVRKRAEGTHS